ncbi:pyrimidine 5'-nucleotidase [Pigmentiphaga litoralis]|uniref:pyrimidine 5'-nucleotidase n=1 Tax=Pigmentiphaga litoralis TaxID=516702 RepID=UPI003B43466E
MADHLVVSDAAARATGVPALGDFRRQVKRPLGRVRASRRVLSPGKAKELVWFFDLDNTLHDASHAIFSHIDLSMTAAVRETLNVSEEEAHALRKKYWQRYGATLIGMVRHHGVSSADFLHRSHNFDIRPLVRADKDLRNRLDKLPGRKVLLTNAPHNYARTILSHLGILRCFDSLWAVEDMRFHGDFKVKPSPALMRHVLAHEGVSAHRAVLVEDTAANLRGARQVGMRTVYVRHPQTPFAKTHRGRPTFIDLQVNSVSHLLLQRRLLRRA